MRRTWTLMVAGILTFTFSSIGAAQTEVNIDCVKLLLDDEFLRAIGGNPQQIYVAPGIPLPQAVRDNLCPGAGAPVPGVPYLPGAQLTHICPAEAQQTVQSGQNLAVGMAGRAFNLSLGPYDISNGSAYIQTIDENGNFVEWYDTRIITYQGYEASNVSNYAAFTITDDWVNGFVHTEENGYWLQPLTDFVPGSYSMPVPGAIMTNPCIHVSYTSEAAVNIDSPIDEPVCHNSCTTMYWPFWRTSNPNTILKATITCTWVDRKFVDEWGRSAWPNKARSVWNTVSGIYRKEAGIQLYAPCFQYYDYTAQAADCGTAITNFKNARPSQSADKVLGMFLGRAVKSCGGMAICENIPYSAALCKHMFAVARKADSSSLQVRFAAHELGHLHGARHCDGTYVQHNHNGRTEYHQEIMGAGCVYGAEISCPSPCSGMDEFSANSRGRIRLTGATSWGTPNQGGAWPH